MCIRDRSYSQDTEDNDNKDFTFSVETKIFTSSLIDQSIELQGQTIHNKKIDVKSETSGNIDNIEFARGDRVSQNAEMITISLEDRNEKLFSAKKDLERLNKELILNEKNRDKLQKLVNLHFVEGFFGIEDIDDVITTKSINGLDLEIKKMNGILYVNGAEVVEANIKFSNGIIHLTNRVLIPK